MSNPESKATGVCKCIIPMRILQDLCGNCGNVIVPQAKPAHTPIPWRASSGSKYLIYSDEVEHFVLTTSSSEVDEQTCEANRALVLKAVNNHALMKAELRIVLDLHLENQIKLNPYQVLRIHNILSDCEAE